MLTIDHSPIFELKHVTKSYGNNMAVKDGNLRIYPGEVHALMGGNGAGKSTMIKIIAGAHQADSGEILLEGKSVAFKHPKEAMDSGIQVVYQELSLLPHLTVSENIAMPSNDIVRHGIYDWKKSDALAAEALSRLGSTTADISPHDIVSELRPDQMQMVEIARAVGQNAKIILLDEPTSSLNFKETEKLFESIRGLCNAGIGIIFVSHRMNEVRELSDRITILRDGVVIVDGVPMSEKTDEEIVSDMLGEKLNAEEKKRKDSNAFESSAEVLSISFDGYDGELTVKEGEIVGLAGLAGSGRSSVLRTIWGTKPRSDIHLRYLGEEYKPKNPMHALKKKIAYISEDRSESELFFGQPIKETVLMAHRNLQRKLLVKNKSEDKLLGQIIGEVQIKVPTHECMPEALSGGNQQKLLFGRWITDEAKLLLLDEPTRGVDIKTKHEIYQRVRKMVEANNAGALVVSSELEELVLMCDKVLIIRDGHVEDVLTGDRITENNMMAEITASGKTKQQTEDNKSV